MLGLPRWPCRSEGAWLWQLISFVCLRSALAGLLVDSWWVFGMGAAVWLVHNLMPHTSWFRLLRPVWVMWGSLGVSLCQHVHSPFVAAPVCSLLCSSGRPYGGLCIVRWVWVGSARCPRSLAPNCICICLPLLLFSGTDRRPEAFQS